MKKVLLLSLLLMLAACGGGETAVSIPDTQVEAEEETAVSERVVEEMTTEEIIPVAAKPQLVEFYADW